MVYNNLFEYEVSNEEIIIWRGIDPTIEVLVIPPEINRFPVVHIERGAFQGFNELVEVHFPKTMEVVENFAFQDCKNLRKVLCLGNEIQFSHAVFKGCTRLETFDAVGTVDLGIAVFENCENLRNFQGSINHIAHKTFKNCKKLNVTLVFADEVYRFHGGAFEGCDNIPCLVFNGNVQVADDLTNEFMMSVLIMCNPECCVADLAYFGAKVDTDCGVFIPF